MMKFRILLSTAMLSSLVFVSCKKELEPQETTSTATETTTAVPASPQPIAQPGQAQPQVTSPVPQQAVSGMNPAHGQPGHRCDISVGAPLNSAAKPATPVTATQSTPAVTQVNPVTTTPKATATSTAKGMNPAHGQPGHRCDISVGAPLNSPAKASAATPVSTANGTSQPKGTQMSVNSNGEVSGGNGGNYTVTRTDNKTGKTTVTKAASSEIPALLQAPAETKTATPAK